MARVLRGWGGEVVRTWARQCRRVAVRPGGHVEEADEGSPSRAYQRLVDSGDLLRDTEQLKLLALLDLLHAELHGTSKRPTARDTESADVSVPLLTGDGEGSTWKLLRKGRELMKGGAGEAVEERREEAEMVETKKGRGVYIHGEVGCGKTLLMDLFYRCVPAGRKRRIHLHAFMVETYSALHHISRGSSDTPLVMSPTRRRKSRYEKMQKRIDDAHEPQKSWWSMWGRQKGKDKGEPALRTVDVVESYIDSIAAKYDMICFDEFQVIDTADAALLRRLFGGLFQRGVTVVCTSNK
eukprot:Hpha_TRINITY_DN8723_c0_g1::TRINITY_DN8723_c0_g1_i1::g.45105::m.45105/K18798/AFG1, LACE1; peroxisome-assembly ATPase